MKSEEDWLIEYLTKSYKDWDHYEKCKWWKWATGRGKAFFSRCEKAVGDDATEHWRKICKEWEMK